jgi:hypothetical protein
LEVFFVIAVIAGVGTALWFGWKAEQERKRKLTELAQRLGFRFHPDADSDHDDRYAQFEIFRRGHSRVALNTMAGSLDVLGRSCSACCGDFRYRVTRSSGKGSRTSTYRFSYLIVHLPWHTPALVVRPEGVFDKIAGAFGFDDIDFESVEFSRRFYVKSQDKRFAYDVLHPRMMEFLLAERPPMVDIEGGAVCLSDGQRRWEPEDYERMIAFLRAFLDQWPVHLRQDLER